MMSILRPMTLGLMLALLALSGRILAQQPTIKEMIDKPDEEKPASVQPARKQPQPETAQPKSKPVQVVLPEDEFDRGSSRMLM